jgi:DNA-binding IclR family transcriptional regulator
MTAFVRAFLRCDGCAEFFSSDTIPSEESLRQALRHARRCGWARRMVGGRWKDYCPECDPGGAS